jgi:hypothetical protein
MTITLDCGGGAFQRVSVHLGIGKADILLAVGDEDGRKTIALPLNHAQELRDELERLIGIAIAEAQ